MKILWLLLLLFPTVMKSEYWQQKVDYDIECTLNVPSKKLYSTAHITYHHHAPFTIKSLKLHLWMNAFKSGKSPFSKQLSDLGDPKKWVLHKEEAGGYDSLFVLDAQGLPLSFSYDDHTQEIMTIELDKPLNPGDSFRFTIRYTLDIPKNISRGGYLGESFQMTQWYPKLAVLDTAGWHTMHYLEFGEYFNEFGDYKVSIHLPGDFIVAATGNLTTSDELKFLRAYADSCLSNQANPDSIKAPTPPHHQSFKTLIFEAQNVIDFAWFADKRFLVNHAQTTTENKTINIWTFFLPKKINAWHQAVGYASKAIDFFSEQVGPYPYDQVSIVECQKEGSDGMEYPMVTLIDRYYNLPDQLEEVILHEVGHNWFQAVLATNERDEAWMDEGLVTFYEHKYFRNRTLVPFIGDNLFTLNSDYDRAPDFLWYLQAGDNRDLATLSPAEKFTSNGYVLSTYEKPAKGLRLVELTLGEQKFKTLMQQYFHSWQFKHPHFQDFMDLFFAEDITWLAEVYLRNNKKLDVSISAAPAINNIVLHQDALQAIPIPLAGYYKGKRILDTVLHGMIDGSTIVLPLDTIDYLIIDPDFLLPEINRNNNILRLKKSAFAPKTTTVHLVPGLGHSIVRDLYLNPLIGFNYYDGFIAGLGLHDFTLPASHTLAGGMVAYGFKSKKPVILAGLEHLITPYHSAIDRLKLSMEIRNFSFAKNNDLATNDRYTKLAPGINLSLTPSTQHGARKKVSYRTIWVHQRLVEVKDPGQPTNHSINQSNTIQELKFDFYNHTILHPFSWTVTAEKGRGFDKIFTHFSKQVRYRTIAPAYAEWHVFAGLQSVNSNRKVFSDFTLTGGTTIQNRELDYKYDELLLGRTESDNSLSRQWFAKDASFRTLPNLVSSSTWMVASSLRAAIPGLPFLRPYVQTALLPRTDDFSSFQYSSGVSLVILKNIVEVNIPLFESIDITNGYHRLPRNNFISRTTYLFNFNGLNPFKWLRNIGH